MEPLMFFAAWAPMAIFQGLWEMSWTVAAMLIAACILEKAVQNGTSRSAESLDSRDSF